MKRTTSRAPLHQLPSSVRRSASLLKKQLEHAAFLRRYHARELLFGKGGGQMGRLAPRDKQYVRFVWREAYGAYLHLRRTGESRYQGWPKRRQLNVAERIEPMSKQAHWNQWYRSQKARYFRFDLPRKLRGDADAA